MSRRMIVGTRKGFFVLDRQSTDWRITTASLLGDHCSMCLHDPRDGTLYSAIYLGHFGAKMHRSRDEGKTWEEIPVPVYPPKPEGVDDTNPMSGKAIPWKLEMIWSLAAGHRSQPGVLWCGTLPGGLFRSNDSGASWELVRSLWDDPRRKSWFGGGADLPGIHSICVDPSNGNRIFLGVSCGGVWLTEDGGQTWDVRATGMRADYMPPEQQYNPLIQDPHLVVQCPGNTSHLWAQHHNGVFRTTDGGVKWEDVPNVQPSVFGFAIAIHPSDPKTVWTIPAVKDEKRYPVSGKVVVARTRNGGES